jgi:SAM-dependent methyltransferase
MDVVTEISEVPEGDSFGLVTMFHVVEHLPEPVPMLQAVRRLVAPGGLLVIEVPHWRSLGRLVRQGSWSQLRPPEHINFLTRQSMAMLLDRGGFVAVRMDTPYPHLHDRWRAARGTARARAAAGVAGAIAAERLHLGGYLRVLARPV